MTSPAPDLDRLTCLPRELLDSTLFLLARVGMRMKGRVLEEFEQAGFSMYQYSVLAILSEGACERQSTMADVIGLDRSQLVGVLDSLEERRLVERRRDPNDRRRHLVSLTPAGGAVKGPGPGPAAGRAAEATKREPPAEGGRGSGRG